MENTIVNQNAAAEQPSVLDLLLGEKVINVAKNLPTAKFEVPRLSEAAGAPVIFTLQALPSVRRFLPFRWSRGDSRSDVQPRGSDRRFRRAAASP